MTKADRDAVIEECAIEANRHEAHLRETSNLDRAKEAGCIARALRRMKQTSK